MKEVSELLETNGIASLCVLATIYILFRVFEFVWGLKKERDKLSEESVRKLAIAMDHNTGELHELRSQMQSLETAFTEFPKFKLDLQRLFIAVKGIAGERWPEIRQELMEAKEMFER